MEGRVTRLEVLQKSWQALSAKIQQRLQDLEQAARTAVGGYSGGGGGGATVWFVPSGAAIAAGSSGTADVYQTINGTNSLFVAGATIYNNLDAATTAGHTLIVGSCGDGTFQVVSQSC